MRYLIEQHLQEKAAAARLPKVRVSRAEFVRLMIGTGASERDAEMQATVSAGLGDGAWTRVGEQMISCAMAEEVRDIVSTAMAEARADVERICAAPAAGDADGQGRGEGQGGE